MLIRESVFEVKDYDSDSLEVSSYKIKIITDSIATLKKQKSNPFFRLSAIDRICSHANNKISSIIVEEIDPIIQTLEDKTNAVAEHAAANIGKLARAIPDIEPLITQSLLNLEHCERKNRDILMSKAIISFGYYFENSQKQDSIVRFVKNLAGKKGHYNRMCVCNFLKKFGGKNVISKGRLQ